MRLWHSHSLPLPKPNLKSKLRGRRPRTHIDTDLTPTRPHHTHPSTHTQHRRQLAYALAKADEPLSPGSAKLDAGKRARLQGIRGQIQGALAACGERTAGQALVSEYACMYVFKGVDVGAARGLIG